MPDRTEQLTLDHEKLTTRGIYSLIRGIDSDLNALKDSVKDNHRETSSRMSRLESEMKQLQEAMTALKISAGITEQRMTDTVSELNSVRNEQTEQRSELRGLSGKLDGLQTRLGWYIGLLGIGISILLVLFQYVMK